MSIPSSTSTTPTVTRAAVIDEFGGAEVLHLAEVPLEAPIGTQVQLEVGAIAVNPVDLSTRAGRNIPVHDALFPMVLGWDVAGTVVALGADVTDRQLGDRVAAMVFQPLDQHGVYAQRLNIDSPLLAPVPDRLGLEQAATVPLAGLTASQLLDQALTDGAKTLLVNGPLGAVGRSLVTLAARSGVDVIGVARPEQADALRALGAASVVARGEFAPDVLALHPDGVDAAVDLVGGAAARATLDSVRDGGRYVTAVPPYIDPTGPFDTERDIALHVLTVHTDTEQLGALLRLAGAGGLPTAVEQVFPLADAADAHRRQAAGGLTGRVLLQP